MAIKYIKLVLNKNFKTEQPKFSWLNYLFASNSDTLYKYYKALDEFIYDFGCITGWERKEDISDLNLLSFSCILSHPEAENDLPYLYSWIERMKDSYNLYISDNIKVSGEIIISVEQSYMTLSDIEKSAPVEVATNGDITYFNKNPVNFTTSSSIKYRLVIDIDNTMCQILEGDYDQQWIENNFPDVELIHWKGKGDEYLHFCYPNFDKLVLSILSWENWSVDIFSAGIFQRNEAIIPQYFISKFSKYTSQPQELYENFTKAGKLQIFSYHHMIEGDREISTSNYERYGKMKKDLSIISSDISNIIIADDDRSYILGDQYPFIALSGSATYDLDEIIRYKDTNCKNLLFNPLKNAEYIMGIILSCKEKMDNNQTISLREALDQVLQHNNQSVLKPFKEHGFREWDYSPWYIEPAKEIFASKWGNLPLENNNYYTKMIGWIDKANDCFDEMF